MDVCVCVCVCVCDVWVDVGVCEHGREQLCPWWAADVQHSGPFWGGTEREERRARSPRVGPDSSVSDLAATADYLVTSELLSC